MSGQTTDIVVHPATGEVLEHLRQLPAEVLADAQLAIVERQAELKEARAAIDTELRSRLEMRGRRYDIYGEFEITLEGGRESVWDPDDTEATLRQLIDDGTLTAGELTGVIRHETLVSRTQINLVLGRLSGPAKTALERCRVWREKGQPRVRVTRQMQLIEEAEK